MKNLLLLMSLMTSLLSAQLKVEDAPKVTEIGRINRYESFIVSKSIGDNYVLLYNNAKYEHLTIIRSLVVGSKDEFNQLYEIIKGDIDSGREEERVVSNDCYTIYIHYYKKYFHFGVNQVGESFSTTGAFPKKKLDVLFFGEK